LIIKVYRPDDFEQQCGIGLVIVCGIVMPPQLWPREGEMPKLVN